MFLSGVLLGALILGPLAFWIGWKVAETVAGTWIGVLIVAAIVVLVALLLQSAVTGNYAAVEWLISVTGGCG